MLDTVVRILVKTESCTVHGFALLSLCYASLYPSLFLSLWGMARCVSRSWVCVCLTISVCLCVNIHVVCDCLWVVFWIFKSTTCDTITSHLHVTNWNYYCNRATTFSREIGPPQAICKTGAVHCSSNEFCFCSCSPCGRQWLQYYPPLLSLHELCP